MPDTRQARMPERFVAAEGTTIAEAAPQRRVLAYGDSLTAGFYDSGYGFAPYGALLPELLAPSLRLEVMSCGLSGLTAEDLVGKSQDTDIVDVMRRVGDGLEHVLTYTSSQKFDVVFLMAGTNDLAFETSPERIVAMVQALHRFCHSRSIPTVALSVPPNKFSSTIDSYRADWLRVNTALAEWAQGRGAKEGVALFVDTEAMVPYDTSSGYWERDGLHMSPEGSRQLAQGLAALVSPLLSDLQLLQSDFEPAPLPDPQPVPEVPARSTGTALPDVEPAPRPGGSRGKCTVM